MHLNNFMVITMTKYYIIIIFPTLMIIQQAKKDDVIVPYYPPSEWWSTEHKPSVLDWQSLLKLDCVPCSSMSVDSEFYDSKFYDHLTKHSRLSLFSEPSISSQSGSIYIQLNMWIHWGLGLLDKIKETQLNLNFRYTCK